MRIRTIVVPALLSVAAIPLAAQEHRIVPGDSLQWVAGPPSLPPGAQIAVLEGDPTKEGPFTMRARLPARYRIPPHTHAAVERVTVISGTFILTMGAQEDTTREHALTVGGFAMMSPGVVHHARTAGVTEIQLNGVGPWNITYVNPADDPRRRTPR